MLRKKIGELFVVGYHGLTPTDNFLKFVEKWGIGGVIVFARNIDDPQNLLSTLKKIEEAAGKKIFTAIDQEGGLVMRILQGGSLFHSAMGLAATNDLQLVEKSYEAVGKEMTALGLNWNLAPVLDINHPANPGIGARSFGDDPEKTADFGAAAIRGLQKSGVLACAKHFPGKGKARVDSHLTLPLIESTKEELMAHELYPFKAAINNNVAAIMTAHVFFPAFEKQADLPATLSRAVLTGLLREELKFSGLLITDDLEMGAITEKFGISEAASRSFLAGADQLLICHSLEQQEQAANNLLELVKNNKEYQNRLETSLERIGKARKAISAPKPEQSLKQMCEAHEPLIIETHKEALRCLEVSEGFKEIAAQEAVLFLYPKISALVQVEESHQQTGFAQLIKKEFTQALTLEYDPKAPADAIISAVKNLPGSKAVKKLVFFSYNLHLFAGQSDAAKELAGNYSESALIALRNPYDLVGMKIFSTRIATFSFRTPALKEVLKALRGQSQVAKQPWPVKTINW